MKKLFLAILIPILFVLGTPALVATIMYDGSGEDLMPVDLYVEDADAEAMIYEELLNSLDDVTNEVEQDFIFNLHEDMINTAIFQAVLEENPDYMPTDDCATPEACYIIYEQVPVEDFDIMLRVVGAWVDFDDDIFSLNVFLEVELNDGFTYKTVITVEFKFLDEPEYYLLQFNKINVGNLPIPGSMISSVLGAIENNVEELDLEELTAELETGEADLSEFTYKLYKNEIIDLIGDDCDPETDVDCAEPTTEDKMLKQVLSEVFEQRIVVFEFSGDEFVASAQLSLFVSEDITDIPEYLYDLHDVDPITGEVGEYNPDLLDQATYLQDMFTEFTFNYALTQSNFQLTEETVNKLIYSSQDGFTDMGQVQELELPDGSIRELELGINGLWFEFTAEGLQAKALVKLDSISSVLTLKASKLESESTPTELVFDFTEITFGEDAEEAETDYVSITDLTVFKEMLAELGDVEFGVFDENGILTISADRLSTMMEDGSADGVINVTGIDIVENAIEISIEAADTELQAALDGLSEELSNVIEGPELLDDLALVLDTTGGGAEQDVYEAVQDLQETLQNEEIPDPEDIEDLFDNFQEMDEETQSEFLDTFANLFDETVLEDFETAFGSFSGGDLPIPE